MLLNISFDFEYLPLLIVVAIAWLVPMFLSVLHIKRIPAVIVEIIAGFLIGRYLLFQSSSESMEILEFLALTGFIFLMFLSGLEIDTDQIVASFPRRKLSIPRFLKNPLLVGLVFFILTLGISYIGSVTLSTVVTIPNVWYFSLIMVTTSVGIIFPVLKSRSETNGHFGQMLIMAAAVADILSILLFTFTAFIISKGFQPELLLVLALFVLVYIFYVLGRKLEATIFRRITFQLSHAASQISIRGTLLLLLVFVVLAQVMGEEVILLGAFLSGLLLSFFLHKERSLLLIKLDGMGFGFFIPVFFIMVGVKFNPQHFSEFDNSLIPFLLLLLVFLYLVKIAPSFLWVRLFGRRRAIAGGFLMSSRLSLIIAASTIGLGLGAITEGINASFVLMAVITCLVSPMVYNNLNPIDKKKGRKVVIVGGSSTGVLLARRLNVHGRATVIVEKDESRCKEIKQKGISAMKGEGTDARVFRELGLRASDYIVVHTGNDEDNIRICDMIRKEFRHENLISKSTETKVELALKRHNVEILDVRRTLAATIENLILRPGTYHALVDTFESFNVEEILVTSIQIDGMQVKDFHFHQDSTLILVQRGTDKFIPHGESYFKRGDILIVFGTEVALEETRKRCSG
ncbi:MAG: monovalent cation:proton antiporter family protein [Bacteroidota bacterium]